MLIFLILLFTVVVIIGFFNTENITKLFRKIKAKSFRNIEIVEKLVIDSSPQLETIESRLIENFKSIVLPFIKHARNNPTFVDLSKTEMHKNFFEDKYLFIIPPIIYDSVVELIKNDSDELQSQQLIDNLINLSTQFLTTTITPIFKEKFKNKVSSVEIFIEIFVLTWLHLNLFKRNHSKKEKNIFESVLKRFNLQSSHNSGYVSIMNLIYQRFRYPNNLFENYTNFDDFVEIKKIKNYEIAFKELFCESVFLEKTKSYKIDWIKNYYNHTTEKLTLNNVQRFYHNKYFKNLKNLNNVFDVIDEHFHYYLNEQNKTQKFSVIFDDFVYVINNDVSNSMLLFNDNDLIFNDLPKPGHLFNDVDTGAYEVEQKMIQMRVYVMNDIFLIFRKIVKYHRYIVFSWIILTNNGFIETLSKLFDFNPSQKFISLFVSPTLWPTKYTANNLITNDNRQQKTVDKEVDLTYVYDKITIPYSYSVNNIDDNSKYSLKLESYDQQEYKFIYIIKTEHSYYKYFIFAKKFYFAISLNLMSLELTFHRGGENVDVKIQFSHEDFGIYEINNENVNTYFNTNEIQFEKKYQLTVINATNK